MMEVQDGPESDTIAEELTEQIATELHSVVCKNGGLMEVTRAMSALSTEGVTYMKNLGVYHLLENSSICDVLKLQVEQPSNRAQLKVVVKVELCTDYKESKCESSECPRLHVCPSFIRGNCRLGERCPYRHNFDDVHEQEILTKHKLNGLDLASLVALLRRVLFGLPIQVCPHYNSVSGCPLGNACTRYHLCPGLTDGSVCQAGALCNKNHDLQGENMRIITSMQKLRARAVFAGMLARFCTGAIVGARPKQPTVDEICGFHIKGTCGYGNNCNRHRHKLPYLWQITVSLQDGAEQWINFPSSYNQQIEQDYCDVNKDSSIEINITGETAEEQAMVLIIYFADMIAKDDSETCTAQIRRLSTASWLKASPGDIYATFWAWHWTNDQNQWGPFDRGEPNCDSSNEKLEENFLSGVETFTLPLNQHSYQIDFKSLQQTNSTTGKVRSLRRRPIKFIGEGDLVNIRTLRETYRASSHALPSTQSHLVPPREWTTMTENQEVQLVPLDPSSNEYSQGEGVFRKTMSGETIHKIERVQNLDLWESYSRKFSKLSRKLGRAPEFRQLFHGTSEDSVAAICQQGFDWRLCGVHGTAYGKGSYFAVNANYSDGYTNSSQQGHKKMFLAKVIVGTYVGGNSSTVRPPPRDPVKPHELHNSCVDQGQNPTIFVIFDNDQVYPELLITYS